jgi:hypothetical protein
MDKPWKRWLAAVLAMTVGLGVVASVIQIVAEVRFGYDYQTVNPIAQGIGMLIGFLFMWPITIKHEPSRRVKSFGWFAAYMTAVVVGITAIRIAIRKG